MCYNAAVLSPVYPAYFASILLFAFASLFFQIFCRQNWCIPTWEPQAQGHECAYRENHESTDMCK